MSHSLYLLNYTITVQILQEGIRILGRKIEELELVNQILNLKKLWD